MRIIIRARWRKMLRTGFMKRLMTRITINKTVDIIEVNNVKSAEEKFKKDNIDLTKDKN